MTEYLGGLEDPKEGVEEIPSNPATNSIQIVRLEKDDKGNEQTSIDHVSPDEVA